MDLETAIARHAEWKLKFRGAITRQETLDAKTIARDNCCELGQWLYGEGRTRFGQFPAHAACLSRHQAFHVEAGKVAEAINARRFTQAEDMLKAGTPYSTSSSAVGVAIRSLQKETQL